jgi:hypothetical protein
MRHTNTRCGPSSNQAIHAPLTYLPVKVLSIPCCLILFLGFAGARYSHTRHVGDPTWSLGGLTLSISRTIGTSVGSASNRVRYLTPGVLHFLCYYQHPITQFHVIRHHEGRILAIYPIAVSRDHCSKSQGRCMP